MKKEILFILLTVLFLAGCQQTGPDAIPTPTESAFQPAEEEVDKEMVVLAGFPSSGKKEDLEEIEESGLGKYNGFNERYNDGANPFCIDERTGAVYFVNLNNDYFIYRLKDGETELVVELPAKALYMYDGVLYFLLESYGYYIMENLYDGDVCAYSPKDGTVELLYAAGEKAKDYEDEDFRNLLQRVVVDEEGIHFVGEIKEELMEVGDEVYEILVAEYLVLPFGADEPIKDKNMATERGWGDSYVKWKSEVGVIFKSRETKEEVVVGYYPFYALAGDMIYGMREEEGTIAGKNLITGEEISYDFSDGTVEYMWDNFIMTEGSVWLIDGAKQIYQYNKQNGKIAKFFFSPNWVVKSSIFTDGKEIYVNTTQGIARVVFLEEPDWSNINPEGYKVEWELLVLKDTEEEK